MQAWLENETLVFYLKMLVCLCIMYIPFIGKYIRLLDTIFHEGGHVLCALLLRCRINKVNLFSNLAGDTRIVSSKGKTFLIALAGYPASAAAAFVAFAAVSRNFSQYFIIALCVILLLFLIFYIRNGFGIFWTITFIALNAYMLYKNIPSLTDYACQIYAFIIFIESIIAVCQLLVLAWRCPQQAGDATVLAGITHIPAFVHALVFMIINFIINIYTIKCFFPLGNQIPFF
ncbi:MAG: M50 family metallopeptidase [Bacteroidales bacterium]|nr:M50 family metallopeptidase [Bacteroidales bacterium]